jgi:hypothetical protein
MSNLMAIMGRGIQCLPDGSWTVTEDLETYTQNGAHLINRIPADDENKDCLVGGGELNILAGIQLHKGGFGNIIVCAYADRAEYLKSVNAPSESMVMSELFRGYCPDALIKVWTKQMSVPGPSNTNRELQNIFELAIKEKVSTVAIVTVDIHMPRVLVLAQRHLAKHEFQCLDVRFFVSEQVLVEAGPEIYNQRCEALRCSKATARNWTREQSGIFKTITNAYGDEKPKIAL